MYYVYILRSTVAKKKFYIGYTDNLEHRLSQHKQAPPDSYTRRYAPWQTETHISFTNKKLAKAFELYLKTYRNRPTRSDAVGLHFH